MRAELREIKSEIASQLKQMAATGARFLPAPVKKHSREITISLISGLAAILAITALGIYAFGWQNPLSEIVTRVVPLPVGYVSGQPIWYHDYVVRAASIHPQGKDANQQAFGELVNNVLVYRLAKQAGITIPSSEVEHQLALDMNLRGGEKAALAEVNQMYGLDRGGYFKRVELGMLRLRLDEWLAQSEDNQAEAKTSAQALLDRGQKGASFDELVRGYSVVLSSQTATPGRMLSSSLPTEVKTALQGTPVGSLVDRPVLANGSYYVVKRLPDDGEPVAQVIVIPPRNLNQWLADQQSAAKPVRLIPQLR